jgi:hypothetical protein
MILQNLVELIQQHHSHMNENEIRHLLNRAADDLCSKSELVKTSFKMVTPTTTDGTTIANQRYYKLPDGILKINEVFLDGVRIPRLIGKPIIDDTTKEEDMI